MVRFISGSTGDRVISRFVGFGLALFILGIAVGPPLGNLAGHMLSAHMAQHLILMLVVAPMFAWARPFSLAMALIHPDARGALAAWDSTAPWRWLMRHIQRPATAWLLFNGTLLIWHLPAIYRQTHASPWLHVCMPLSFLIAGWLFWSVVLETAASRRLGPGRSMLFVLTTAMVSAVPGALLAFARQPIYGISSDASLRHGLTPLADQQLAGLLMWIPMDLMLFGTAAFLFCAWLRESGNTDNLPMDPS
ncbi:MAG: cytochrome c oxidase assembly protein [Pseudomonadota bacterium]